MKALDPRFALAGALLLCTLASGYWLSHSGKPYSVLIFTVHKLIALGAVIATGAAVYHLRTAVDFRLFELGAIIVTGLLFLALFVSGGILSAVNPENSVLLAIHRAAPFLAVVGAAATAYLLLGAKQLM